MLIQPLLLFLPKQNQ